VIRTGSTCIHNFPVSQGISFEWVSLSYCSTSSWLLSRFSDFSSPSRFFIYVYGFTKHAVFVFYCVL